MRKMFLVMITFDHPCEGTLNVAANSKEHATELALKMIAGRKNATIVDVVGHDELPPEAGDVEEPSDNSPQLLN